ncbi:hypothetical protein QYF61_021701 [Mycteria americana]|uniref:Uncharacterized protein n=1 Tax=Mycteria americana TaxID=33587 RepID=A0AAN7NVB8_MYCAM|nr:hypothetical protein QYF61_021701 [Mycteria americana]
MGKCLGWWSPPMFWNFTPEQVQNPEKLVEYLEKVCCHPDNSKEIQITAMCWGLAHAYQDLFNTIENPQGSGDKTTDTTATPAPPATGTMATVAPPATGTAAIPDNSVTGTGVTPAPLPETGTAAILASSATSTAVTPALLRQALRFNQGTNPCQDQSPLYRRRNPGSESQLI